MFDLIHINSIQELRAGASDQDGVLYEKLPKNDTDTQDLRVCVQKSAAG